MLIFLQSTSNDSSGGGCCFGGLIIVVVIIVLAAVNSNQQSKAKAQALEQQTKAQSQAANARRKAKAETKAAYEESLAGLKSNPTSADQWQKTLQLGRAYSGLTRDGQGVTVFDEVALMNDMNAACAGVSSTGKSEPATPEKRSIEERLGMLGELKVQGLLDDEEYRSRRQKILDEV